MIPAAARLHKYGKKIYNRSTSPPIEGVYKFAIPVYGEAVPRTAACLFGVNLGKSVPDKSTGAVLSERIQSRRFPNDCSIYGTKPSAIPVSQYEPSAPGIESQVGLRLMRLAHQP